VVVAWVMTQLQTADSVEERKNVLVKSSPLLPILSVNTDKRGDELRKLG